MAAAADSPRLLWVGASGPAPRTAAALQDQGYALLHAEPGPRATALCRRLQPAAVVLVPVGLAREALLVQVTALRAPLLVLLPRVAPLDEVRLLEAGADLVLPADAGSLLLLARLRALMRRSGAAAPLRLGALQVDPPGTGVRLADRRLDLGASAQALVHELAACAGRPAPRARLARHLGPAAADGRSRTLDMAISRLRRQLRAQGAADIEIEAVRGQGYRLVLCRAPA